MVRRTKEEIIMKIGIYEGKDCKSIMKNALEDIVKSKDEPLSLLDISLSLREQRKFRELQSQGRIKQLLTVLKNEGKITYSKGVWKRIDALAQKPQEAFKV
jgi:hypothetical protein